MKTIAYMTLVSALAGITVFAAQKVQLSETPTEVQKTIQTQLGTNEISAIKETKSGGKQAFAVQFRQNNQSELLLLSSDGTVLKDTRKGLQVKEPAGSSRSRLALTELPKPVQDTILTQSKNDQLPIKGIKIKQVKEDNQDVYKVEFQEKGKNTRLWISPDGSLLKQEK